MTILTLQRRLREAGRIRIGQTVPTGKGRGRPEKLDKFRLTSADKTAIFEAARLYGGDPHIWEAAPVGEVWEVFTDANALPIVVPPAETVFSQFMETWSGGGCTRRCDGQTELLTDSPCLCVNEDEASCKPTTRLSVILQELPGLGVWRLESHGWYAATELAGTVEVVMRAGSRGQLLPAVLRLEQRQVKKAGESVKKFAVPVLDIQVTPTALGLVVGTQAPQTGVEGQGSWQSIAHTPAAGAIGAGEVGAAIRDAGREPAKRRKNSPPELPATGLAPRGLNAATEPPADAPNPEMTKKVHACFNEAGIKDREDKLAFIAAVIGHPVESWSHCTKAEGVRVIDAAERVNTGTLSYTVTLDGSVQLEEVAA